MNRPINPAHTASDDHDWVRLRLPAAAAGLLDDQDEQRLHHLRLRRFESGDQKNPETRHRGAQQQQRHNAPPHQGRQTRTGLQQELIDDDQERDCYQCDKSGHAAGAAAGVRQKPRSGQGLRIPEVRDGEHRKRGQNGNHHDRNQRVEVELQLLETHEIPWRFRRVGAHAGVGRRAERRVEKHRNDEDYGHQRQRRRQLPHQEVGQGRHVVRGLLLDLARGARVNHTAGLTNPPEVKAHQQHQGDWKQGGVEGVEENQGRGAEFGARARHLLQPPADPRYVAEHAGTDCYRPVGELVPGQKIPREIGGQHTGQERHTDHPVELAGAVKAAGEEDPQHMGDRDRHQEIGAPVVDVANQASKKNPPLQSQNRLVGPFRGRLVGKHHQDAGHHHERNQDQRAPAETKGVGVWKRRPPDPHRPQVEDKDVEDRLAALTLGARHDGARKDRSPDAPRHALRRLFARGHLLIRHVDDPSRNGFAIQAPSLNIERSGTIA